MKTCNFPIEITKQEAQSLRVKMRKVELYLKGATVITPCLPKLALEKLERLDCSHWFYSEHRREYQSKLSNDHSSSKG